MNLIKPIALIWDFQEIYREQKNINIINYSMVTQLGKKNPDCEKQYQTKVLVLLRIKSQEKNRKKKERENKWRRGRKGLRYDLYLLSLFGSWFEKSIKSIMKQLGEFKHWIFVYMKAFLMLIMLYCSCDSKSILIF